MSNQHYEQPQDWRNQEFMYEPFHFQIIFNGLAIILVILIGFVLFPNDIGYRSNLFTTGLGVLVTVRFVDLLNRRREEMRYKAQLIREMGNVDNGIAARAIAELNANKWGFDSDRLLNKVYLHAANLRGGKLSRANLAHANLGFAQLQNSMLDKSNLQNAFLGNAKLMDALMVYSNSQYANFDFADLREAHMAGADLRGARFNYANLEEAIFWGADLRGANLLQASLVGVGLVNAIGKHEKAIFDDTTILPDGNCWTPATDMRRFTDPKHLEFWKSMILEMQEIEQQTKNPIE
ncbi:MAG: pentapeptide repeat-containing protein [Chloroflexi bacterium]|nr:pentapeptide repeat-containing protein [Chloroflexota bacterium]MCC6896686.1 pentapeptide repeat-containing protein [Anaerolineae bacterium]